MNTRSHLARRTMIAAMASFLITGASMAHDDSKSAKGQGSAAGQNQASGAGSDELHRTMMGGMEQMRQMKGTGDLDKDFAMMMRMHHQQAVEMAKIEAQNGKSAELKAMANKMIADQQKEIAQLDAWLQKNK